MIPPPWPILSPSRDDGHACPDWLRLTSARCHPTTAEKETYVDPAILEAREAELEERRRARQEEREHEAAERRRETEERRTETRRLRAELSAKHRAEAAEKARAAKVAIGPEEIRRRIREGIALAQAEGRMPTRQPPKPRHRVYPHSPDRVPPEGMVPVIQAAREHGYNPNYLTIACKKGKLPAVQKGTYWYVRLADVGAYKEEAKMRLREAQKRNAAVARAAKAARPWAKLCPRRKKGAA